MDIFEKVLIQYSGEDEVRHEEVASFWDLYPFDKIKKFKFSSWEETELVLLLRRQVLPGLVKKIGISLDSVLFAIEYEAVQTEANLLGVTLKWTLELIWECDHDCPINRVRRWRHGIGNPEMELRNRVSTIDLMRFSVLE